MKPIKHKGNTLGCHGSCCLKVDDLTVTMGEDRILDHVSFHMHCGELIALIGPNGRRQELPLPLHPGTDALHRLHPVPDRRRQPDAPPHRLRAPKSQL